MLKVVVKVFNRKIVRYKSMNEETAHEHTVTLCIGITRGNLRMNVHSIVRLVINLSGLA
jgi:hypothetical protein